MLNVLVVWFYALATVYGRFLVSCSVLKSQPSLSTLFESVYSVVSRKDYANNLFSPL